MENVLKQQYRLKNPTTKRLVGYDIVNYRVEDGSEKYILKVYPDNKNELDFAGAENEVLLHLQKERNSCFPHPLENPANELLSPFEENETKKYARLLTFLEGTFLGETEHSKELLKSFGSFLAQMDVQLKDFRNYVVEARTLKWDLQHFLLNEEYVSYISNPSEKKIVAYFFQQYKENVLPVLPALRKQIIHSDANDWNTLTQNNRISGLIDFGDLCYSHLINEAAIALAYALMGKDDPVEWAVPFLEEYNKVYRLEEKEVDVLYWLIAARLCTSVCNSAYEKVQRPENTYIQISEKPAWDLLKKWVTLNPIYARNEFRNAAGFEVPKEKAIDEVQAERFSSVNPIFSVSYKTPIYMERAAFQYMFDKYGKRYLDAYNNIPHVGHSHPKVVETGQKQMAKLNTNTRYLYDQINAYTGSLLRHFPKPLNKVFLVNSGSAASDLAIRLVRNFTGKKRIAALEHGYHGNTNSVIEISHYKFAGKGGQGASENVLPLPMPDIYRGEFQAENAGTSYAEKAIQKIRNSDGIAAFIAEPVVGCGGQVPLASGYLKEVYAAVRAQNGLCISDEVQTGFGRLGDFFWGFEAQEVVPDIVILGKPMGNGHPIGAVVTTDEIADAFNNGMEFFSSFGGNPVSCAIGQAVLDVIDEEKLQRNAKEVGDYYMRELTRLQQKYECIGDVRGAGLFIGFELVKHRLTLEPDTALAQKVKNELRNRYILVSTDGPYDNVIKSKPPLCFSKENVDEVIHQIDAILKQS
ncbi:aminotransferase class III-fold pyridoxal phosphate-dependent enzyme [Prolixibacteraceae bacterium Z1-6]|uniref:Aminotransferase class III-fold pyridoxal phosphate-dependent enzyme n=1 Tax=Draconibacterium aestuarii TaxID=2998507 RepID=A0A9X3F1Y9_9BACT|nr:aminotransferase class III-fold pyridoxal phosphate-dependent enzyme [Prolixibacteraceae bacterium Z1-6]